MIRAQAPLVGLVRRLADKAERLALAHAPDRRRDPTRWRRAALLWPLFTREES